MTCSGEQVAENWLPATADFFTNEADWLDFFKACGEYHGTL
jgi:hypothetical protein